MDEKRRDPHFFISISIAGVVQHTLCVSFSSLLITTIQLSTNIIAVEVKVDGYRGRYGVGDVSLL